nr:ethylene-responsive transcription factor 3-like [Ipomoea batatas]
MEFRRGNAPWGHSKQDGPGRFKVCCPRVDEGTYVYGDWKVQNGVKLNSAGDSPSAQQIELGHREYARRRCYNFQRFPYSRPASSSLSSTVESSDRNKQPPPPRLKVPVPPLPDDCHIDCDSSSSVVDDQDQTTSSFFPKQPLSFDLNLPPPPLDEFVADELKVTALHL